VKLPIKERKKYVIRLLKEGYTERQIANELHMSTRDVVKIRKDNEREENETRLRDIREKEREEKEKLFSSKRAEALQLYKKGINPLDVAIELKISAEEAKEFYYEYCSLLYPPQLLEIYKELNKTHSFNHFIELFNLIIEKNLSIEEAVETIGMIKNIHSLKVENSDLDFTISNLKRVRDALERKINSLKCQSDEIEQSLSNKQKEIELVKKALKMITKKIRQQQEKLHKINSGEDYFKARKKIKLLVEEFLSNKTKVISLSVTSIITVIKEDPNRQTIIDTILNSSDKKKSDPEAILFLKEKLRECAEKIYQKISESCTDSILH
jgi:hypothetical protein